MTQPSFYPAHICCACILSTYLPSSGVTQFYSLLTIANPLQLPIAYDVERPQTQTSTSGHSLLLKISEMAKDTATVVMECE